jgi:arylsulfatase A-like enzyme
MVARLFTILSFLSALSAAVAVEPQPNIIFIYSDEYCLADPGMQGLVADIRTPNLDPLAQNGRRFKRRYVSAPHCVPLRAGVMTGRCQERFEWRRTGAPETMTLL